MLQFDDTPPISHSSTPSFNEYPFTSSIRDDWNSNLSPDNINHFHKALKHLELTSILKLARKSSGPVQLSSNVFKFIDNVNFLECDETQTLPRTSKLCLPPYSYPNIAVSMDFISHIVHGWSRNIMVLFIRCALLADRSDVTAFHSFYTNWIS